jgi:hypothetical protein
LAAHLAIVGSLDVGKKTQSVAESRRADHTVEFLWIGNRRDSAGDAEHEGHGSLARVLVRQQGLASGFVGPGFGQYSATW